MLPQIPLSFFPEFALIFPDFGKKGNNYELLMVYKSNNYQ